MRIGVVAGALEAEIGGGWTFASALIEELNRTQSKHEFIFLDKFLQSANTNTGSFTGLKPVDLGTGIALIQLQEAFWEHVKNGAIHDSGGRGWLRKLSKYLVSFIHKGSNQKQPDNMDLMQSKFAQYLMQTDFLQQRMPDHLETTVPERLERVIEQEGLDLLWYMIPNALPVSIPFIATVLDLEHRKQPYFPEVSVTDWTWVAREENFLRLLPRATFVLTGTEQGKKEIVDFYSVNPERVKIVPLPTSQTTPPSPDIRHARLSALGISGNFLLYPAQFWPHKNHVNILMALDVLHRYHHLTPNLVLTGSDKTNRSYIHETIQNLNLSDRVFDLGFVSRQDLITLYASAQALVYPSFFGPDNLPPLEAASVGCPAAVSDIPGAREQLGEGVSYFDPTDPQDMAMKLAQVINDNGYRQSLLEAGKKLVSQRTTQAYVATVCDLLDGFKPIRRCWATPPSAAALTTSGFSFAQGEGGVAALKEGWGEPEPWGCWSVEEKCTLRFNLDPSFRRALTIAFKCRVYLHRHLNVGCYVESMPRQSWKFSFEDENQFTFQKIKEPYKLQIDPSVIRPNGDVYITFLTANMTSPAEAGINADVRRLGVGFERVWLDID